MASSSRICRLCRSIIAPTRVVHLFSSTSIQKRLDSRIADLLEVPVDRNDGLPAYICHACSNKISSLEKAQAELAAFRAMAKCSYSAMERGPLKRTKQTSGDIGVSQTLQDRGLGQSKPEKD